MKIEFDIKNGKLLVQMVSGFSINETEVVVAQGELEIGKLFDEMARIQNERRSLADRLAEIGGPQ